MGMTVEDCILALTKERKTALHENKQAFDMAIETMRKYQQIEQEIKQWHKDGTNWSDLRLMEIERIIDGNDD